MGGDSCYGSQGPVTMALFDNVVEIFSFYSALLLLLLNAQNALGQFVESHSELDPAIFPHAFIFGNEEAISDADHIAATALHSFKLCSLFFLFDEDLGFWMKPCSTTMV